MELEEIQEIIEANTKVKFGVKCSLVLGESFLHSGTEIKFLKYKNIYVWESGVISIVVSPEYNNTELCREILGLFEVDIDHVGSNIFEEGTEDFLVLGEKKPKIKKINVKKTLNIIDEDWEKIELELFGDY